MSTQTDPLDRLYRLLPVVHRLRDSESGEPLRALLQVISRQVNAIEADIGRQYDNWFIETCDEWVVPYLGDLIGYQPATGLGESALLVSRSEVANTIRARRRKGTLALLEQLARDVADWPAHAVEFHRYLARTQCLDAVTPDRGRTADLRNGGALGQLGGAFDAFAHTLDVRRINSRHSPRAYSIPAVGLFVSRLKPYSITRARACCLDEVNPRLYTFSVLGNDVALVNRPLEEGQTGSVPPELKVPATIRRRAFAEETEVAGKKVLRASSRYYGLVPGTSTAQSLAIWVEGWIGKAADDKYLVPRERIIPADLSDWSYVPPRDHIAVDPALGRIAFPGRQLPRGGVWVSYHYAFSADMGGGEYPRPLSDLSSDPPIRVRNDDELREALQRWRKRINDDGQEIAPPDQPKGATIELVGSSSYTVPISIFLGAGHTLQIRAAQRARPVLRMLDYQGDRPDNLTVAGEAGSRFILDGVLVAGRGLQVEGPMASVIVRHSTLVPGRMLDAQCTPRRPAEPSIELINSTACIVVTDSIIGSIQVNNDEVAGEPVTLRIRDSIVDSTHTDCDGPECEAIGAVGLERAHAVLRVERSTVIGSVQVHAIELAENSLFVGCVTVARRQVGCMRFCYVRPTSRTPPRFNCQPELAERASVTALLDAARDANQPEPAKAQQDAVAASARRRVKPVFNSMRYGSPTYCQLAEQCPPEILRGADDESEMGVFHNLFQPQRLASLQARLEEFTPASTDAAVVLES